MRKRVSLHTLVDCTHSSAEKNESFDRCVELNLSNDGTEALLNQPSAELKTADSLSSMQAECNGNYTEKRNNEQKENQVDSYNLPAPTADKYARLCLQTEEDEEMQVNQHSACPEEPSNTDFDNIVGKCREALRPIRVLSYNMDVPVINLSNGPKTIIFFTSGHLGVIYDVSKNNQFILRGHVCAIV